MPGKTLDRAIGTRIRALREAQGLSLGDLAAQSGVSKAMIARIEKAESSATAALLGRLCAGLGVTLSSVLAACDRPLERLSRRAEQPVWRDPETGYVRRHVSPPGAASGVELVAVELPPGARVPYPPWGGNPYSQQIFIISGELRLQIGEETYDLNEGDCIDFDVMRPTLFENRAPVAARYIVFIRKG